MAFSTLRGKVWAAVVGLVAMSGVVLVVGFQLVDQSRPAANLEESQSTARADYAAFYEAAWRSDGGTGNVLMTATLFLPPTIQALGNDPERSDVEDQLYRQTRELQENQAAIFITTDSAIGALSDATVGASFSLAAMPEIDFQLLSWEAQIPASSFHEDGPSITPQTGVVIFETTSPIEWSEITQVTLTSSGVGDTPERTFLWVQPKLLLEVEP